MICLERVRGHACAAKESSLKEIFPHNQTAVFPAVDASTIDVDTDSRLSPFARYHIKKDLDTDFIHTSKVSAVGCSLSHIALWQRSVASNEAILVLEDDVKLDKDFMEGAIQKIPDNIDFASIVYLPFADRSDCGDYWCQIQPRSGFGGTQMYYVTPRGASILLEQALPIVSQIDVYIGYVANTREDFKSLFYKEEFFSQYEFWSDFHKSTIGHNIEIKKFLPDSNMFYFTWIVCMCICVFCTVKLMCRNTNSNKHKV